MNFQEIWNLSSSQKDLQFLCIVLQIPLLAYLDQFCWTVCWFLLSLDYLFQLPLPLSCKWNSQSVSSQQGQRLTGIVLISSTGMSLVAAMLQVTLNVTWWDGWSSLGEHADPFRGVLMLSTLELLSLQVDMQGCPSYPVLFKILKHFSHYGDH